MNILPRFLGVLISGASLLAVGTALPVRADDPNAPKVTEADFPVYYKLAGAQARAEEQQTFAHDQTKRDAITAEWNKALADAGWTQERFDSVNEAVGMAAGSLQQLEAGGEEAENAKSELAEQNSTTIATVKAHRKELAVDLRIKAAEDIRNEQAAARRGTPPTPSQLAGTWVLDIDATIDAAVRELPDSVKPEVREKVRRETPAATYTFGPGNTIKTVIRRPGSTVDETSTGTYRLDGSKIYFQAQGRKGEDSLEIGMKNDQLRLGFMGVYSVLKRE